MASLEVYSQEKKKLSSVELGEGWNGPVMKTTVFDVALWQQAGRRSGTASSKERSDVKGSGRKIYRQKGTGNARHKDRQANIFVGGGIAFGPKPKDWSFSIPKKQRRAAICSVLIHKLRKDKLRVVDSLDFGEIKTKKAREFIDKWELKNALLVLAKANESVVKSVRNIPGFKTCAAQSLNVADLLLHDVIILTKESLEIVEKQWVQKT